MKNSELVVLNAFKKYLNEANNISERYQEMDIQTSDKFSDTLIKNISNPFYVQLYQNKDKTIINKFLNQLRNSELNFNQFLNDMFNYVSKPKEYLINDYPTKDLIVRLIYSYMDVLAFNKLSEDTGLYEDDMRYDFFIKLCITAFNNVGLLKDQEIITLPIDIVLDGLLYKLFDKLINYVDEEKLYKEDDYLIADFDRTIRYWFMERTTSGLSECLDGKELQAIPIYHLMQKVI